MFDRKADMHLLVKCNEVKADKAEVLQTNILVHNLNERLKFVSVMQNALAETLEPVKSAFTNFDPKT